MRLGRDSKSGVSFGDCEHAIQKLHFFEVYKSTEMICQQRLPTTLVSNKWFFFPQPSFGSKLTPVDFLAHRIPGCWLWLIAPHTSSENIIAAHLGGSDPVHLSVLPTPNPIDPWTVCAAIVSYPPLLLPLPRFMTRTCAASKFWPTRFLWLWKSRCWMVARRRSPTSPTGGTWPDTAACEGSRSQTLTRRKGRLAA